MASIGSVEGSAEPAVLDKGESGVAVTLPQTQAVALVRELASRVGDRRRAATVLDRVVAWEALPSAQQPAALPGLYLRLEDFLTRIDGSASQDELRHDVAERFPALLQDSRFGLIFADDAMQELLLGRELLIPIVDHAVALLGDRAHPSFFAISRWLRGLHENIAEGSAGDREHGRSARQGWAALLDRLGQDLFDRLREILGGDATRELFEARFDAVAQEYLPLDTFPAVVRLFPPELLDEAKLSLLSRSQTRQVLFDKLGELQTVNQLLEENNADLQMALEVLERSHEQLEARVDERTGELLQAKEEIEQSEERLRRISDAAHDAIFMIDARGRTTYLNLAAQTMLGFTFEQLCSVSLVDKVIPRDIRRAVRRQFRQRLIEPVQSKTDGVPVEMRVERRDGQELPVELTLSSVAFKGRSHLVAVVRDISERKRREVENRRLEEQIQEAQRLESLGVLSGGIAHDFNNLLTTVLGHVSLIEGMAGAEFEHSESLQEIRVAGQRMADLTEQMLAYSGRGHFVVESVHLPEVIAEMSELLLASVSKGAALDFRFEPDLPPVLADRHQMSQLVMNLITNASDALMDRDGRVSVAARLAEIGADWGSGCTTGVDLEPGPHVLLEVRDSGCGMDDKTRSRMFEPFFSTHFAGRGLGLAAVSGIVRGHQGAICVESQPGQGSTVTIALPLAAVPEPRPKADDLAAAAKPARVLVADDESGIRFLARLILEQNGYLVTTADDGRQAVEAVEQHGGDLDLVILDLTMPAMNGEQALAVIHQLQPDLPVLLSSGYSRLEAMKRVEGRRIAGFVTKPYEVETLLAEVRQALAADSTTVADAAATTLTASS